MAEQLSVAHRQYSIDSIDRNSRKISMILIELVEHVQQLQNRINELSHLPNNGHSLQVEISQQKPRQEERDPIPKIPEF